MLFRNSRRLKNEGAVVVAARSSLAAWLVTRSMRRLAKRRFHSVGIAHDSLPRIDAAAPIIIYSNHPSWWDPVMFALLQAHVFKSRIGFGPMEVQALRRYKLLQHAGIFGLEPDTHTGARRFLRVGTAVLRTPGTILWVTAEGHFSDARIRPVKLRPGVAHLLRSHPGAMAIPLALEFPFWSESTPEALARFGDVLVAEPGRSVAEWEAALEARLTTAMDRLSADAIARDPGRFKTLLAGRVGVGGAYDMWRRVGALLKGRVAQLAHGGATPAGSRVPQVTQSNHD